MAPSNVLLTGGNGFIAVHVIDQLLQKGYTVTTTVRSESKTTHLRKLFSDAVGAGNLKFSIIEDMVVPGAFDNVIKENTFDAIVHTSSPVTFSAEDLEKDILQPAIHGTTEVLKSAKAYGPTVKRVVYTSSFAAIGDPLQGDRPGYVYSEKDWSPLTYQHGLQNGSLAYITSKALAEKSAWEFIEQEKPGFDLATICPTYVFGPALQEVTSLKNLNGTSQIYYDLFNGDMKELTSPFVWIWVDVRDVAKAHVAALEKPEAGGKRFFVTEANHHIGEVADYIWKHYPERAEAKGIPKSTPSVGYPPAGIYTQDNSVSKSILGIEYTPIEDTLRDQLAQFVKIEKELAGSSS